MIKNYLITWLLSVKRQKGFMLLNFSILVASMIVLTVLIGAVRIMSGNDILKEDNGKLYILEWSDNQGKWQTSFDTDQLGKINEISRPSVVCSMGTNFSCNMIKKGKQSSFNIVSINKPFSEILNAKFISGNNFTDKHFEKGGQFAIISQKIANYYFGETDVIGNEIVISNRGYTVIGVFRNLPENKEYEADVYTAGPTPYELPSVACVILRVDSGKEFADAGTMLNKHMKSIIKDGALFRLTSLQDKKSQTLESIILGSTLMFVFAFLLPALLLSNLTIHRMESRLNELGIRKAFGADKKTIYWQLIAENLVFTLLAGIVALCIGQLLISSLYYGVGIQGNWFSLTLPSDLYFLILLAFILFGVITGIIPARLVSRQSIVCSLNTK
jgi:putative ABC transport system permease protein